MVASPEQTLPKPASPCSLAPCALGPSPIRPPSFQLTPRCQPSASNHVKLSPMLDIFSTGVTLRTPIESSRNGLDQTISLSSRQHLIDDFAGDVGEAEVAALEAVGELEVIDPE